MRRSKVQRRGGMTSANWPKFSLSDTCPDLLGMEKRAGERFPERNFRS